MIERSYIKSINKRYEVAPTCPCGKSNKDGKFSPFEDNFQEGYCHSCGKNFFNKKDWNTWEQLDRPVYTPKPVSYFDRDEFKRSMNALNDSNTLIEYLRASIGLEATKTIIEKYNVGTSLDNNYDVVFWYVDKDQNVRSGKIMQYENGHRKKWINWTHSKKEGFNFKRCLFGEHLINESNDIAIVESEKTALICAHFIPEYVWMAAGGSAITEDNFKALHGKNVYLFPDNDKYYQWLNYEPPNLLIHVSDIMEQEGIKKGSDLADLLIKTD